MFMIIQHEVLPIASKRKGLNFDDSYNYNLIQRVE
jgi:hypothetical protein